MASRKKPTPPTRFEVPPARKSAWKSHKDRPMSSDRVHDLAILFWEETGQPCLPVRSKDGYAVTIPAEYLEDLFVAAGVMEPREG